MRSLFFKIFKFVFLKEYRCWFYCRRFVKTKNRAVRYLLSFKLKNGGNCISHKTRIGTGFFLPHPYGVVIGEGAVIGENVQIFQNVTIGQKNGKYPVIGNNCIIYPNAVVIGDIRIGDNCIIGAGSVVLNSVPANTTVAGNPAKIIADNKED